MTWQTNLCVSEHGPDTDFPDGDLKPAVQQLITTQRQLADVIDSLTDDQYRQKPVGLVPSSVGGHVRHCLDHVQGVLAAAETGQLNYDHRERGTEIELNRSAALRLIRQKEGKLERLTWLKSSFPLQLTALLSPSLPPVTVATSLGRELAFVLSHTVHHSALVAVMVKLLGQSVPERFGYAPATIAHLERVPCAQ
jgi:uncharacterized damage-inducible protein DinB